ncbi:hypothetical protein [Candidatus Pristimantibacillus sp. PTI5]|uniref:hypothetical protein n=1 Tax=Candidatus Pristimantibacillus sp. PTI5 TaxID=3400422 RepID=UPI003B02A392
MQLEYEENLKQLLLQLTEENSDSNIESNKHKRNKSKSTRPRIVDKLIYSIEVLKEKDFGFAGFNYKEDIENGLFTLLYEAEGETIECIYNKNERDLFISGLSDIW